MVIGLPDRLASTVAPGQRASALGGTGTHMSSQISTCSTKPGRSVAANSRSGPNGTCCSPMRMRAAHVVAGCEMTALVELAIVRQVRLGHDAQHRAAVDHHRSVVEPVPIAQRGADHQHRQQIRGRRDDVEQRLLDRVEQRVLQQHVVDRVARQRQLGEDRQRDAVVVAFARQPQHRRGVGGRIADGGVVCAGGDPHKTLA